MYKELLHFEGGEGDGWSIEMIIYPYRESKVILHPFNPSRRLARVGNERCFLVKGSGAVLRNPSKAFTGDKSLFRDGLLSPSVRGGPDQRGTGCRHQEAAAPGCPVTTRPRFRGPCRPPAG
jgi:hypothetical protein